MTTRDAPPASRTGRPEPPRLRKLLPSLLINLIVPVVGYLVLRPYVPNDAVALAIVGAIPVLRTAIVLIWRRRVDPIGVLAGSGFLLAVAASLVWGGSSLPLKLHEAVLTGTLGLACLISAALGKPLHLVLVNLFARNGKTGESTPAADTGDAKPRPPGGSPVVTLMIGTTFLVHAIVHVALALTLPTSTFLVASRVVGWAIFGLGAALLVWYVHGRKNDRPAAGDSPRS